MKIYVAAQFGRLAEVNRDVVPKLVEDGHTVTSQWLNTQVSGNLTAEEALMCLDDVMSSDVVLVLTNPMGTPTTGGGRWFEAGFAYALKHAWEELGRGATMRVIFVGGQETVFCYLDDVEHYGTLDEAREMMREPAECAGCGVNWADPPSDLCPGCQTYKEHQQ